MPINRVRGYQLGERIGAGGFGEVYRAYQPDVEREVAIKVIRPEYVNSPEFIRRFEVEAHIIARLEHIHIIPLYDYWREPTGAYLVMRWLPDNLRKVIREGVPPLKSTAAWLDQIASGLMAAHRHGVVHRDLKPDNILLDDESNIYLADFGIAKIITEIDSTDSQNSTGFVGSVAYSSPEQLRDEKVTTQSDIYSLGVMLFELLVGSTPFAGESFGTVVTSHLFDPLPPLNQFRADLPEQVNAIVQKATHKEPAARFEDVASFALAFNQAISVISKRANAPLEVKPGAIRELHLERDKQIADEPTAFLDVTTPGFVTNPFKGLRSFNEADAGDFFGREDLTRRLVARLAEPVEEARLLAVIGPSGSGKTSVVMAGLVPAIRHGAIPGSDRWFEIELTPGNAPLKNLEAALLSVAVNPPPNIRQQLARDRFGFLNLVKAILPGAVGDEKHLLVVIDQFEEVFTLTEDQAAIRHFLELIHTAVTTPGSPIHIVLTLRADMYDRPLLYPEFGDLIRKRTEVVLPLTIADLTDAIIKPCSRVGVMLEPHLIAEIIKDVSEQPGALPLMQYALTELYSRRKGRVLTVEMYHQTGGVLGALAQRADELFENLDETGQYITEQLFLRLVTLGDGTNDTRRRAHQAELLSISEEPERIREVIGLYTKYWLLTFDSDPVTHVPTLEIAHEALIQCWDKLQTWLADSREQVRLQRLLAVAASEWLQTNRDLDYLAVGARLSQFQTFADEGHIALNEEERLFVEASIAAQQAREAEIEKRRENQIELGQRAASLAKKADTAQTESAKRLAYLVGVLLLFLVVGTGLLIRTWNSAQQAEDAAQQAHISAQDAILSASKAQDLTRRTESLRLATSAVGEARADNGILATLLALRSIKVQQTLQGDAALQQALAHDYTEQIFAPSLATIQDARFSPDGQTVVAVVTGTGSSPSSSLKIWDVKTGALLHTFSVTGDGVRGVAFAHSGKYLAVVNGNGTAVSIWDMTGDVPSQLQQWKTDRVKSAVFSPDDRTVLTADNDNAAHLRDIQTGSDLRQFTDHGAEVESAVFSTDGKAILTASLDGIARLYDAGSGALLRIFTSPKVGERLHVAVLSPDGKFIAGGGYNELVYVWDAATGMLLQTLEGHADEVISVAFSPDGNYIVSGSADLSAIVWNRVNGAIERHYIGHADTITHVSFSPDGASVLTVAADGTARLWLADDSALANDSLPRQFTGHTDAVYEVAFSPKGDRFASASKDDTARIWDIKTGKQIQVYTGHSMRVWWIAFSPDGSQVITASDDGTAQIWDANTGKTIHVLKHTGAVWTAAFSPDGTQVVTGGEDNIGHIWNVQTGKEVLALTGHTDRIYGASFSPDGKTVVTVSVDKSVRLWDAHTGKELRQFLGHQNEVYAVAFSHDGTLIATASRDKTARIWDVATGSEIHSFTGHNDVVWTVQFSKDDKQLLTAGQDGTARIWDIDTGTEYRRLTGHTQTVTSASFSPDNQWVATTSYDHTIRLTRTAPETLVSAACKYVVRDFTDAERAAFGIEGTDPTCP